MDTLTCGICLDVLRVPVCTPCGHMCCEACLTAHIEVSADAMNATCPTCRTPFPIALPELRFVPQKYHPFLMPSVRRVYIPADPDTPDNTGAESRRELRAQVVVLDNRITGLLRDKTLLMDRCEAALRASQAHAEGERDQRLAKERLERELHDLRAKYTTIKGKYRALKTVVREHAATPAGPSAQPPLQIHPTLTSHPKRKSTSNHSGRDASLMLDVSGSTDDAGTSTRASRGIAKRPRLLGSPFDLAHRIRSHPRARASHSDLDGDRDEDSTLRSSDLSSSAGPQRSGLPEGDIFSPTHWTMDTRGGRGGRGSIDFAFGGREGMFGLGGMRPAWMLSPEGDAEASSRGL